MTYLPAAMCVMKTSRAGIASPEQGNCKATPWPVTDVAVDAPRTYLSLLTMARMSAGRATLVLQILDVVATHAYCDVDEPCGAGGLGEWLEALVKPRNWQKHPQWVRAIENRLDELAVDLALTSAALSN
jgi:hypothetical protein